MTWIIPHAAHVISSCHMNKSLLQAYLPWAIVITLVMGTIFGASQQAIRLAANDPQIQVAEDVSGAISQGQPIPPSPKSMVDAKLSLSPFVSIFGDDKAPVYWNAQLNDKAPTPPAGTFDYVKDHGQNRFTWQPASGERFAAVLLRYGGEKPGYVMVARSLRESELRIKKLGIDILIAWAVTMVAVLGALLLQQKLARPSHLQS